MASNRPRQERNKMLVDGVDIIVGDRFRECDNRFERFVTVTAIDVLAKRVQLNNRTWAMAKRFKGKHGGYKKMAAKERGGK